MNHFPVSPGQAFNGGVFTDFDMTSLPMRLVSNESTAGHQRFKSDAYTSTRVGHGGTGIQIDGFNGEIRIHHVK